MYSETSTEGGHWAFQDGQHIRKNVGYGYCKKCGISLAKQSGAIQLQRVYPIDEEALRTGKLPKRPDCRANSHEEETGDRWSYEGLHILRDGDHLTIYNPQKRDDEL